MAAGGSAFSDRSNLIIVEQNADEDELAAGSLLFPQWAFKRTPNDLKLRLIQLVRERPSIWNPRCREYRDAHFTANQWQFVAELCGLGNGNEAKKIFQGLRAHRRKVKSRKKQEARSGMGTAEVRPITWAYYYEMSFLDEIEGATPQTLDNSAIIDPLPPDQRYVDENVSLRSGEGPVTPDVGTSNTARVSERRASTTPKRQRKSTEKFEDCTALMDEMSDALRDLSAKYDSPDYSFCINLYNNVKEMPEVHKLETKQKINEIVDKTLVEIAKEKSLNE